MNLQLGSEYIEDGWVSQLGCESMLKQKKVSVYIQSNPSDNE